MGLMIPDDLLDTLNMSQEELRIEIAALLYSKGKITLGRAADFAGLDYLQFQQLMASRKIAVHYDAKELDEDIATLDKLNKLNQS